MISRREKSSAELRVMLGPVFLLVRLRRGWSIVRLRAFNYAICGFHRRRRLRSRTRRKATKSRVPESGYQLDELARAEPNKRKEPQYTCPDSRAFREERSDG
jgi:hypothetical protein